MSTDARKKQVAKILDLRTKAAEKSRLELAAAEKASRAEAVHLADAEHGFYQRSVLEASMPPNSVDELEMAREHLKGLSKRVDAARTKADEARKNEEVRKVACVSAERELRKIELWRDQLDAADRARAERVERLQSDAFAQRAFARSRA